MSVYPCSHVPNVIVPPASEGCAECLAMGDEWVHLRLCVHCGHVGCCDSSKNRHATAHFQKTGHPVIASLERDEDWMWCFVHESQVG